MNWWQILIIVVGCLITFLWIVWVLHSIGIVIVSLLDRKTERFNARQYQLRNIEIAIVDLRQAVEKSIRSNHEK